MLVYGPTSGCYAENAPGYTVTVWNTTQWASATTAQFAAFNVIVFDDCPYPITSSTDSLWNTAIANEATWAPAVKGNVIILGTDPDNHYAAGVASALQVLYQSIGYAAGDPLGRTGLFISLSQAYDSAAAGTGVPLLSGFGNFTVQSATNSGQSGVNDAHIIAVSPALVGMTDAELSNWSYSVHEGFDSWPSSFLPLAIATDAAVTNYVAPDDTEGMVYILTKGNITPVPTPTFTATSTWTFTPTATPTPTWTPTPCGWPGETCTPTPTPTLTPTQTFTPVCVPEVWPDPFSPRAAVGQVLKVNCLQTGCTVSFFTVSGELVLPPIPETDGMVQWNGKNAYGVPVATGIYFYAIQQGNRVIQTGKFLVVH